MEMTIICLMGQQLEIMYISWTLSGHLSALKYYLIVKKSYEVNLGSARD